MDRERHGLRPAPPPVPVDLGAIVLIGQVAWLVGLLVTGVLAATHVIGVMAPITCVIGLFIGWLIARWAHRQPRDQGSID